MDRISFDGIFFVLTIINFLDLPQFDHENVRSSELLGFLSLSFYEIWLFLNNLDISFNNSIIWKGPVFLKTLHLFLDSLLSDSFSQSSINVLARAVTWRHAMWLLIFNSPFVINPSHSNGCNRVPHVCRSWCLATTKFLFLWLVVGLEPVLQIEFQFKHQLFLSFFPLNGLFDLLLLQFSPSFTLLIFFTFIYKVAKVLLYILIQFIEAI